MANIALSYASCCICHLTSPLTLYFAYSTRSCALTSIYNSGVVSVTVHIANALSCLPYADKANPCSVYDIASMVED